MKRFFNTYILLLRRGLYTGENIGLPGLGSKQLGLYCQVLMRVDIFPIQIKQMRNIYHMTNTLQIKKELQAKAY